MLPAPQEGVKYIVSWQEHENVPVPESMEDRKDVEVYRLDLKGLSSNRNNAIEHCKGDIILISDDDLRFKPDFANKICNAFEDDKDVDLGIFKIDFFNGKDYPAEECRLILPFPKNYYCSSVEIAFRRKKLKSLKFWNKMGLGNEFLQCGEDELFLLSAIKRGYNCKFFNKEIAIHPQDSTGDKTSEGIHKGQGFILGLTYPFSSVFRIPLKAYRTGKTKKTAFLPVLFQLSKGYFYSILKSGKIPKECRW